MFGGGKTELHDDYAFKLCPQGSAGEGTLVIAHMGTAAIYAAAAMGDHEQCQAWEKTNFLNEPVMLYGVQCNIRVSVQARDLTLVIADDSQSTVAFIRTLGAGGDCSVGAGFGLNHLKAIDFQEDGLA